MTKRGGLPRAAESTFVSWLAAVYENQPLALLREVPHVLAHGIDGNALATTDFYNEHDASLRTVR